MNHERSLTRSRRPRARQRCGSASAWMGEALERARRRCDSASEQTRGGPWSELDGRCGSALEQTRGALERARRSVRLGRSMDGLGLEGGAARPRLERDDAVGDGADRPRVAFQADRPRWRGFELRTAAVAASGRSAADGAASSRRRQRWRLQADRPRVARLRVEDGSGGGAETRRKGSADSMLSSVELGGCSAELRRKREERVAARSAEKSVERLGAERSRNSSARRYRGGGEGDVVEGRGSAEEASVSA
uniref:Uncharacterized protein n=1 Tax=Ananas comosus var. bracteatus TaxID=296719 RepID=A0A6V7PHC0_ANACO|nr:unnamed protein product [Ananas comosus var. bracteatus]